MPTAVALTVHWSERDEPIYSAHFEPHGKGRLATAGGDNNVRIWKLEGEGEERRPVYLSTLAKHNQAVNVVRFCPKGEMLASAGDDGNIILWVPAEHGHKQVLAMGEEDLGDKETWRLKHMCRSMGSEIYDLAWSPDGMYFITGSMDNIARVWNAQTGQCIRMIAEHNHYVQGVAWDPLNEYVATQSSDRSVHIYTLKTKDGQPTLSQHGTISRMDLPPRSRRISSNSPAPPDFSGRSGTSFPPDSSALAPSPVTSTPGTPLSTPMNPPVLGATRSRRSSFTSSSSPSLRRSTSPSPAALPLPAVKPMESPKVHGGVGVKNANIYYNETLTSFFRRLTFTPDGSLLLTPAGQYKTSNPAGDSGKSADNIINTVYIYTRAGLNKPPIAHLPGHKKPSIAIKCSPILYTLRKNTISTKTITLDTSSSDDAIPALPPPALSTSSTPMDPPPRSRTSTPGPTSGVEPPSPPPVFSLPYRMVYAVATQDSVLIYDTQQHTPICVVSNLHYAAFTDFTWSPDGLTLLMTSTDGFCSVVCFAPNELGEKYTGPVVTAPTASQQSQPTPSSSASSSTTATTPRLTKQPAAGNTLPPPSPARSSTSSSAPAPEETVVNNPISNLTAMPGVAATVAGVQIPMAATPPETPAASIVLGKRDEVEGESVGKGDKDGRNGGDGKGERNGKEEGDRKRRRIAPTLVRDHPNSRK